MGLDDGEFRFGDFSGAVENLRRHGDFAEIMNHRAQPDALAEPIKISSDSVDFGFR